MVAARRRSSRRGRFHSHGWHRSTRAVSGSTNGPSSAALGHRPRRTGTPHRPRMSPPDRSPRRRGKLNCVAVATPSRLRVRHPLPAARWPTREEAARARWFTPVRLGLRCVAADRTWVPAMVPWRATEDGFVTPDVLDWYGRFAEGQPGRARRRGDRHPRRAERAAAAHRRRPLRPGLRRLVEAVRERSEGRTRLFIQIIDFLAVRRRPGAGDVLRALPRDRRRPPAAPGRGARRRRAGGRGRSAGRRGARAWSRRGAAAQSRPSSPRASSRRSTTATASASPTSTCRTSATCPRVLPGLFADAARPRARGRLRRRRAPLRPRLHDGVVPLAD